MINVGMERAQEVGISEEVTCISHLRTLSNCFTVFFHFLLTVKAGPHECVIRTGQP